jgi:hypothetical protein
MSVREAKCGIWHVLATGYRPRARSHGEHSRLRTRPQRVYQEKRRCASVAPLPSPDDPPNAAATMAMPITVDATRVMATAAGAEGCSASACAMDHAHEPSDDAMAAHGERAIRRGVDSRIEPRVREIAQLRQPVSDRSDDGRPHGRACDRLSSGTAAQDAPAVARKQRSHDADRRSSRGPSPAAVADTHVPQARARRRRSAARRVAFISLFLVSAREVRYRPSRGVVLASRKPCKRFEADSSRLRAKRHVRLNQSGCDAVVHATRRVAAPGEVMAG